MARPFVSTLAAVGVLIGSLAAADAPKEKEKPARARLLTCADTIQTLIEMSDQDPGCTEELQKVYDLLRKLDTNKNGKLDPQALKAESENILQERVKEAFNRLDTNKDGKISKDEAKGRIKEDFDKIDVNKDGFITMDELLKAAKERHDSKPAEKEKK